jgi:hypothetical protein
VLRTETLHILLEVLFEHFQKYNVALNFFDYDDALIFFDYDDALIFFTMLASKNVLVREAHKRVRTSILDAEGIKNKLNIF